MIAKKVYKPEIKTKEKTIIIYHGWGSVIESQHELATTLSQQGYEVIVPEIMYHDSRSPLPNPFDLHIMQEYFWKAIFHTIDEIEQFIHELHIPKEQLILIGSSMGGFIANGIFTAHPGFAGLVNINGSGSYVVSENIFRQDSNRELLSESNIFVQYDPRQKEVNYDTPIILMHGELDSIVSIKGQEDYFAYLTGKGYSEIQFNTYPTINHTISSEMVDDLMKWLNKTM